MIKPVIALFLAYQLVVDAQCTGCWIGTSGPCKQSSGVCWASNNNRCPQGTDFCGTPATPGPSSTPLPGSDCLDCSPPSSGKCKAPHDGVCHAEMPGNPENDNCPPDTTRCYPIIPEPTNPPLPGSDCLDCSSLSSGKCKAPHDGVCHAEMPGNPENDNCPPGTNRCYPQTLAPVTPAPVTPAPTPATEVIFTEDFTENPGNFGDVKINRNGELLIKKKKKATTSNEDIRDYSEVQFSFDYSTDSRTSENLKVGYKFKGHSWTDTDFIPAEERVTGNVFIAIPDNSRKLKFRFKGDGNTRNDIWRIDNVSVTGTVK